MRPLRQLWEEVSGDLAHWWRKRHGGKWIASTTGRGFLAIFGVFLTFWACDTFDFIGKLVLYVVLALLVGFASFLFGCILKGFFK